MVVDGLRRGPLHREFTSFFGFIHIFILFLETEERRYFYFQYKDLVAACRWERCYQCKLPSGLSKPGATSTFVLL